MGTAYGDARVWLVDVGWVGCGQSVGRQSSVWDGSEGVHVYVRRVPARVPYVWYNEMHRIGPAFLRRTRSRGMPPPRFSPSDLLG